MPDLCLNDCGFYSGANAEGLCSYCFREAFPEKAAEEADKKKKVEKKEETSRRGKRVGRADENKDLENNIKTLTYSTVELDGVVSRVVVIGNNQSPAKQRKPRRTEEEKEAMRSKKKEERKALKSVFTSMLILLTAIYSVFGMLAACVLFNTSVSFFFHTREQRIKRKAEGQGGEDDAVKKEKTATDAVNTKAEDNDKAESKKKTQKARCKVCAKKLGLTGFTCRCDPEVQFCALHRQDHGCTFDYNAKQKEEVALNNPLVKAEKVSKI